VLERWRIDPAGGKVVTQLLTTDPRVPRVDERTVGAKTVTATAPHS